MIDEVLAHIKRAHRSYQRFSGSLGRLPQEYVDAEVWHAIVRGYYALLPGKPKGVFPIVLAQIL